MKIAAPAPYDIVVRRGDTFRQRVTAKSGGVPVDITSYSFLGQIRSSADASEVLASFSFEIVHAANGIFEMSIAADVTAELPTESTRLGVYDVQWTTDAGDVRTIMRGVVYLESDVAR